MRADGIDKFFNLDKKEDIEDDKLIENLSTITDEDEDDSLVGIVKGDCIDIFGEPHPDIIPEVVTNDRQELLTDSDFVRNKLKNILNQAETALEMAIKAQEEEEGRPRNTEAIAGIMDTMNKTLKELVSLNKVESEIALKKGGKISPTDGGITNITNQTLILSPEEAIRQITNEMKKG